MPTAAQRQRMAAAAAAVAAPAAPSAASTARKGDGKATSSRLAGNKSNTATTSKPTFQVDASEFEDAFSDDDEEEQGESGQRGMNDDDIDDDDDDAAVAFEMDGQELWAQNYCATCDCLIEPGQGVGPKKEQQQQQQQKSSSNPTSPTASLSRASSGTVTSALGVKSKSGTIKARPTSSDGHPESSSSNLKRTSSAGRIHTVGSGGAPLGPHKRTGSAASRLNALSELKPTTKLHPDGETKARKSAEAKVRAPGLARRNSSKSAQGSADSSPVSPNSTLPRTKKGGLLGPLTPAALKQEQEAETARLSAPPALYCSERCRMIDEQRSSGLGELIHYLSDPLSSPTWVPGSLANAAPSTTSVASASQWPARVPSLSSMSPNGASYGLWTPESECTCPDCLEKSSAVPSGASDTTESSGSNVYGPTGRKQQRSQSGRIVTPQNLVPPGSGAIDGYFGAVTHMGRKGKTRESPQLQPQRIVGRGQTQAAQDSVSNAGTESSTRSSDSSNKSDVFDRNPTSRRSTNRNTSPKSFEASEAIDERDDDCGGDGTVSSVNSDERKSGTVTTGTVTPAAATAMSPNSRPMSMASIRPSSVSQSYGSSPYAAAPLRLLRRGDHHAEPSVDVTADFARSPSTSNVLSRSMASERTEMGSSSITLGAANTGPSSLLSRRQERFSSLDPHPSPLKPSDEITLSKSYQDTSAIETLKSAQARASMSSTPANAAPKHHRGISETASPTWWPRQNVSDGAGGDETGRRSSMTAANGSWLRTSLSSAWATIRGLPTFSTTGASDDVSASPSPENTDAPNSPAPPKLTAEAQLQSTAMARRGSKGSSSGTGRRKFEEDVTAAGASHDGLVRKPTTQRGNVPAFAHEIGRGQIPGEAEAAATSTSESKGQLSRSATTTDVVEEEKRRRRAQHKHQRSKDVTALPPLLGASRPGSSTNLYAMRARPGRTHSTTSSTASQTGGNGGQPARSRAGSNGPVLYVGSAGSHVGLPANGLSRPTTPGMRRSPSGASTPPAYEVGAAGFSPGRNMSFIANAGTSPRRAGLGWGAMTSITGTEAPAARGLYAQQQQHHHHHLHRPHHTNHHQAHHRHHQHHHGPPQARPHQQHRSGASIQLGNLGLLGHHPHGHASMYGRHATTPVRSSTPRVPEEGGEMSGAALKGEVIDSPTAQDFDISRPKSAIGSRRHHPGAPPRPRSTMAMRPHGVSALEAGLASPEATRRLSQHDRTRSYESASSGVKFYPVLEVSGQQTHDRYDAGWNLEGAGLTDYLPRDKLTSEPSSSSACGAATTSHERRSMSTSDRQVHPSDAPRPNRKKLFYFDAT